MEDAGTITVDELCDRCPHREMTAGFVPRKRCEDKCWVKRAVDNRDADQKEQKP